MFDSAIDQGLSGPNLGLFNNGVSAGHSIGRIARPEPRFPRLSLRLSPDYMLTRFGGVSQNEFAISVGVLYRFNKMRKH